MCLRETIASPHKQQSLSIGTRISDLGNPGAPTARERHCTAHQQANRPYWQRRETCKPDAALIKPEMLFLRCQEIHID